MNYGFWLTLLPPSGICSKSNEDCGLLSGTGMAATTHNTQTNATKFFIVLLVDCLFVYLNLASSCPYPSPLLLHRQLLLLFAERNGTKVKTFIFL